MTSATNGMRRQSFWELPIGQFIAGCVEYALLPIVYAIMVVVFLVVAVIEVAFSKPKEWVAIGTDYYRIVVELVPVILFGWVAIVIYPLRDRLR